MPGKSWNDDLGADGPVIAANASALLRSLAADASRRQAPTVENPLAWHAALYAGCSVPVPEYVGHYRGDGSVPALVGYEVGLGAVQHDGLPEKVGVWSPDVVSSVAAAVRGIAAGVAVLDSHVPVGRAPSDPVVLDGVVRLAALAYGEWVRLHPFANGNGRIARVWAAWVALRYGLPVFVTVKPRPAAVAYANAGRASMGRPPAFLGDHAMAENLFARMLRDALAP